MVPKAVAVSMMTSTISHPKGTGTSKGRSKRCNSQTVAIPRTLHPRRRTQYITMLLSERLRKSCCLQRLFHVLALWDTLRVVLVLVTLGLALHALDGSCMTEASNCFQSRTAFNTTQFQTVKTRCQNTAYCRCVVHTSRAGCLDSPLCRWEDGVKLTGGCDPHTGSTTQVPVWRCKDHPVGLFLTPQVRIPFLLVYACSYVCPPSF